MEPMSQTTQPTADATAQVSRAVPGAMVSTAQLLVFDPGLFIVDMAAPQSGGTDMGLRLPAIRLDMTPPTPARPGQAVVTGALSAGWMWRTDEPVFVLVTGGRVGMVLTIYRPNSVTAPPEIRFRQINTSLGQADAPAAPEPAAAADLASEPLTVLAHVRNTGDVSGPGGRVLGVPGSNAPIEGFAVTPGTGLTQDDIEYQAILGNSWNTPWFAAGEFCGSRGMLLPLLGVRIRLKGAAAEVFTCRYVGHFQGRAEPVTAEDGAACAAGDAPLEALQVVVVRRNADATPPAPAPAPATPKSSAKPAKPSSGKRGAGAKAKG
jgi:hypothetical protein